MPNHILSDQLAVTDHEQEGIALILRLDYSDQPNDKMVIDHQNGQMVLKLTAEEAVKLKNWLA